MSAHSSNIIHSSNASNVGVDVDSVAERMVVEAVVLVLPIDPSASQRRLFLQRKEPVHRISSKDLREIIVAGDIIVAVFLDLHTAVTLTRQIPRPPLALHHHLLQRSRIGQHIPDMRICEQSQHGLQQHKQHHQHSFDDSMNVGLLLPRCEGFDGVEQLDGHEGEG